MRPPDINVRVFLKPNFRLSLSFLALIISSVNPRVCTPQSPSDHLQSRLWTFRISDQMTHCAPVVLGYVRKNSGVRWSVHAEVNSNARWNRCTLVEYTPPTDQCWEIKFKNDRRCRSQRFSTMPEVPGLRSERNPNHIQSYQIILVSSSC